MRGRAIIPLVVGLGVGLVALKVFVNVLQKAKGATTGTVAVVYATTNIEPTLEITESMVEVKHITKDAVSAAGFHEKSEVVGRVTSWPIPKGSAIAPMHLAAKGTPPGMAVRIPDGYRAVAVKIDESAGVAGWIKPGSKVDVVVLLANPERGTNESICKTILQDIEVLAAGQDIGKAGEIGAALTKSVTLLVQPADVPKLHLAETKGKLRLSMRSQHDNSVAKTNVTTDNDLLSLGDTSKPAKQGIGASFMSAFLAAQAKRAAAQTDKDPGPKPMAVASAEALPPPEPVVVEVYRGASSDLEQVKFQRHANEWQKVEEPKNGSRRSAAVSPQAAAPASIISVNREAPTANAGMTSLPNLASLGLGGPAKAQ